jgi:hypothetical protein
VDNPDGTLRATDKEDPDTVATTCPEEHSASVITSEEKRRLEENSEIVDTLEDIYSLTCVAPHLPIHATIIYCLVVLYIFRQKDRTSRKSILTPEESGRFRRAVYRIWVYTNIFSGDRYSLDEIDDLGPDTIHFIRRQRTAVLNEYPTDELLQIYAVVRFFRGILDGLCNGDDDNRDFCFL